MLEQIHIENYKCFDNLKINELGQVNLIVGKNGIGKTALLDFINSQLNCGSKLVSAVRGGEVCIDSSMNALLREVCDIFDMQFSKDVVALDDYSHGFVQVLKMVSAMRDVEGGVLLIDEFEGGLHYSVIEDVWRLLFRLAKELNVQIFATTHSWDCVSGFANVGDKDEEVEGVAFRLGKSVRRSDKGRVISTRFSVEELLSLVGIESDIR